MINVSGLAPAAQPIVRQVAGIYLRHTTPWFVGLLVHGSAAKGGYIPGCSDIDFHLYLQEPAFSWHGQLPLELGFAIRRDLALINPAPFRYIQCYAQTGTPRPGFIGPIPGTYHMVAGTLPAATATAVQLQESARKALAELDPAPSFLMGALLGQGDVRLARKIRLLCTKVWPVLYQVLTMQESDAFEVWALTKQQAMERLPEQTALGRPIRQFYQAVQAYYPAEDSLEGALAIIESGAAFLAAAQAWWAETETT